MSFILINAARQKFLQFNIKNAKYAANFSMAYLNTWHENLKFTYEIENCLMLSFLGVNVLKIDTGFMSSIHYKQTHTCLFTNFCSKLPDTYKKGAFTGLLFRIYSLCGNWSNIINEFTTLRKLFADNC